MKFFLQCRKCSFFVFSKSCPKLTSRKLMFSLSDTAHILDAGCLRTEANTWGICKCICKCTCKHIFFYVGIRLALTEQQRSVQTFPTIKHLQRYQFTCKDNRRLAGNTQLTLNLEDPEVRCPNQPSLVSLSSHYSFQSSNLHQNFKPNLTVI